MWQSAYNRFQFAFQPSVQHLVGTRPHAFHAHLPIAWSKQREHFGCAGALILVLLLLWLTFWLPAFAFYWLGLEWSGFVFAPNLQPATVGQSIGLLDQCFFACVSGSMTVTGPLLRKRTDCPV